jgi:Tol biopolymer transport system component
VNGKWADWQYAGDLLNEDYEVGEMHITADGQHLYFHSARAGGLGGLDIWRCDLVDGEWQLPVNVEEVNTDGNEGWPFISQDGNELWFTRTYMGTPGIFRSLWIDGSWSEPELIVSTFAGEPTLDQEGNLYFVHHFFENGTMIEADIYVAYRN